MYMLLDQEKIPSEMAQTPPESFPCLKSKSVWGTWLGLRKQGGQNDPCEKNDLRKWLGSEVFSLFTIHRRQTPPSSLTFQYCLFNINLLLPLYILNFSWWESLMVSFQMYSQTDRSKQVLTDPKSYFAREKKVFLHINTSYNSHALHLFIFLQMNKKTGVRFCQIVKDKIWQSITLKSPIKDCQALTKDWRLWIRCVVFFLSSLITIF